MKITVDTNFLISSTQWDYSVGHKLLINLIENNVEIYTTNEILEEFSKVLKRDFKYNDDETANIIEGILPFLILIDPKTKVNIVKDDPDDNKIIECALESDSEYIITYDNHLLKLKEYKGIRIIKPEEARAIF
tara:strand:+ start:138 stop:536 length:399 start_codon:yes stop_codon:yes gene_type:complete